MVLRVVVGQPPSAAQKVQLVMDPYTYIQSYVYVYMYIHTYVEYVCMYIYIYMWVYVYTCCFVLY